MKKHRASDVAKWFIAKAAESGDLTTHLKVQKLLYYGEAWSQALTGQELFNEDLQAWAHGPVVPEVFKEYREHSWNALPIPSKDEVPVFDSEVEDVLNQVFDTYGDLSAKTLEHMSHKDEPWINARGGRAEEERCETIIPKSEIGNFFKRKYLTE